MGNYATNAELIARFGSTEEAAYATDSTDVTTPTATVLTEAIGAAEGEMNSYIGVRYEVPVSTTDPEVDELLTSCALDMAKFHVFHRKPSTPEGVARQYDRRIEWLKMVADGTVVLPATVALTSATAGVPAMSWSDWKTNRTLSTDGGRLFARSTCSQL
jgi:phage gp36-like protein